MGRMLSGLAGLVILVVAIHYFWVNGWDLVLAKLGEPPEMVTGRAMYLLKNGKADDGISLLTYQSSLGNRYATMMLAVTYEHGRFAPKDSEKAFSYFKQLADSGNGTAMNEIGLMYYCGQLGAPDLATARAWVCRAASAGSKPAQKNLQELDAHRSMRCTL